MWESRMFLAGFPRGLWKGWEACLRLPCFPQPRHFHGSPPLPSFAGAGEYSQQRAARSGLAYCGPASFFFLLPLRR